MAGPLAVVAVGDEGQGCYARRQRAAAHRERHPGARRGRGRLDVADRHRRADARAEAAAGDAADGAAGGVVHARTLARGGSAFGPEPDQPPGWTFGELAEDDGGTGEAALG